MIVFALLCLVPASLAYECTKVNGIEGACDLMLHQITLAGSRLSGCGAYGQMYYWSGGSAPACYYSTQDKSITEQLEMGIRNFDFDISFIHKSEESLPYWEEGPVLVSIGGTAVAYSRSLRMALEEIRDFLNANRDEVLSMQIGNYYPQTREIRDHLLRTIKPLFDSVFGPEGSEGVQLTFFSTLRPLRYMIESNERMVMYLNKDLWGHKLSDYRAHPLVQFVSENNHYSYYDCHTYNPRRLAEEILKIEGINKRHIRLVVNWWLNHGSGCVSSMAASCIDVVDRLEVVWDEILAGTHLDRPINVAVVDYVRPELVEVVSRLNKKAVEYYKAKPW